MLKYLELSSQLRWFCDEKKYIICLTIHISPILKWTQTDIHCSLFFSHNNIVRYGRMRRATCPKSHNEMYQNPGSSSSVTQLPHILYFWSNVEKAIVDWLVPVCLMKVLPQSHPKTRQECYFTPQLWKKWLCKLIKRKQKLVWWICSGRGRNEYWKQLNDR